MRTLVELHAHTTASDGLLSPGELVALCAERGVEVLAVTDHDNTAGIAEARAVGVRLGVRILAGIEASTHVGVEGVHLLGLDIDPDNKTLGELSAQAEEARTSRAEQILGRLAGLGISLDWNSLSSAASVVTRPHIAAALVEEGHVADHREAFDRFLARGAPAHVALGTASAAEWIAGIQAAGGLAVLAHPGQWTAHATLRQLVAVGLDGVEVCHPSHDRSLVGYYSSLVDRWGLMATGGADFHGRWDGEADGLGAYTPNGRGWDRFCTRVGI